MKIKRNKEKIKVVEASNEEVKDDVKIDSILSKENEGSNHLATITTLQDIVTRSPSPDKDFE